MNNPRFNQAILPRTPRHIFGNVPGMYSVCRYAVYSLMRSLMPPKIQGIVGYIKQAKGSCLKKKKKYGAYFTTIVLGTVRGVKV